MLLITEAVVVLPSVVANVDVVYMVLGVCYFYCYCWFTILFMLCADDFVVVVVVLLLLAIAGTTETTYLAITTIITNHDSKLFLFLRSH